MFELRAHATMHDFMQTVFHVRENHQVKIFVISLEENQIVVVVFDLNSVSIFIFKYLLVLFYFILVDIVG